MRRLVAITGMSGSGKTLAARCFEDLGFFCVDNLPVDLITPFRELIERSGEQIVEAALVVDARERTFLERFPEVWNEVREQDLPAELLFFDCSDEVLKRRFSETRRPHPMSAPGGALDEAIAAERRTLEPLRHLADRVIDTSRHTPHELRAMLEDAYRRPDDSGVPNVNIMSFGFKYGAPSDADLLFDVRFLPNPYFVARLRDQDGRSTDVQEFLTGHELFGEFERRLHDFVSFLIPHYDAEGKTYLRLAVGCTGGKHRSVALAERLAAYLREQGLPASVSHRDLGKE